MLQPCRPQRRSDRSGLVAGLVGLLAFAATAAEPGLRARMTREELIARWDLDRDGTIDAGEAAVAASKMRLDRASMRLDQGVDPITGMLRGYEALDDDESLDPPAAPRVRRPWDREPTGWPSGWGTQAAAGWQDLPAAPETGSAVGDGAPASGPAARVPGATAPLQRSAPRGLTLHGPIPGRPLDAAAAVERIPARAARLPGMPQSTAAGQRTPATGGVRAGAAPARPGYGGGPATPLNAGRPRDSLPTRGGQPTGAATTAPRGRPPLPGTPRSRTPGQPYDPY